MSAIVGLSELPIELVHVILVHAARMFAGVDRSTAVAIASTSHAIYDLVAPVVYATLVVTRANLARIQALGTSPRREHVMKHTRQVHLLSGKPSATPITSTWHEFIDWPRVTHFSCKAVVQNLEPIPRLAPTVFHNRAEFRTVTFAAVNFSLARVTHYMSGYEIPRSGPAAWWTAYTMNRLPVCSHVALDLRQPRDRDGADDSDEALPRPQSGSEGSGYVGLARLKDTIWALLDFRRLPTEASGRPGTQLEKIALYIERRRLPEWREQIEPMLHQLLSERPEDAGRLWAWVDTRPGFGRGRRHVKLVDAIDGRNVWSEAVVVESGVSLPGPFRIAAPLG